MIIVSQIKEMIVNFDTICVLGINKNNPNEILSTTNNGNTQILGAYATASRAQEVLQEIVGLYRRCQQVIGERGGVANFICPPKVYEMPKE